MSLSEYSRKGCGVYMFIRFPAQNGNNVHVVEQACVLSRRAVENLRGRILGIASEIEDYNYGSRRRHAMAVLHFQSSAEARLFFQSDPRFKQPDFPPPAGSCDAWTVVKYYAPERQSQYTTFMMSEVRLLYSDYDSYKRDFAQPFAQLLLEYDAHPFVVQSLGVEDLRRHYTTSDTIVAVHLFKSKNHLADAMRDRRWYELRRLQAEVAVESCCVFTLDTRVYQ